MAMTFGPDWQINHLGWTDRVGVTNRVGVADHLGVTDRLGRSNHVGVTDCVGITDRVGMTDCVGVTDHVPGTRRPNVMSRMLCWGMLEDAVYVPCIYSRVVCEVTKATHVSYCVCVSNFHWLSLFVINQSRHVIVNLFFFFLFFFLSISSAVSGQ